MLTPVIKDNLRCMRGRFRDTKESLAAALFGKKPKEHAAE
jgi:hypothetical protein